MKIVTLLLISVLISACGRHEPKPWEIVCDGHGHYTFTTDRGLWCIEEFNTIEEAEENRDDIRAIDSLIKSTDLKVKSTDLKAQKDINRISNRTWEKCSKEDLTNSR